MKQVVQNYNTGSLWLEEVPRPICRRGGVLVRNEYSVVSTGTERMKVSQARMSLLQKARARPDKVRQVVQNLRQEGLRQTINKVQERLDSLTPLGYSSAGVVVEVGDMIDSLAIGDRVACAGEGIACHAEYISVPRNLCARIPDGVSCKDAAFATIGAIAMNGVRQARVSLGDTVLVIGLGLVGLLGVQILRASGCRVIGVDIDPQKLGQARECGAEAAFVSNDPALQEAIAELTGGRGVDSVYIAASTNRTDPMDLAGAVARDRGNVVIVGMVPVEGEWQTYYDKELNIIMARSYGPGRYDRNYEDKGIDYPAGYVPWTERRNLEEFLRLLDLKSVSPSLLQPAVFPFDEAAAVYKEIHEHPGNHAVGVIFEYEGTPTAVRTIETQRPVGRAKTGDISVALIGAGNFATGTLIPALKACANVRLHTICSARGLSARSAATRHGFEHASSDVQEVMANPQVDAVVVATRHDTHAAFAIDALNSSKHVFVEKPLAMSIEELDSIMAALEHSDCILMPGFNRRFSPLSVAVRDFFATAPGAIEVICRVNAGAIGRDSWYQDVDEGGWRILSEGCHFVDLISFITRSQPETVHAAIIGGDSEGQQNDNCIVTLTFASGSIASLAYLSNGDPSFDKERIEVFGQGRAAVMNNWRSVSLSHAGKVTTVKPGRTGKGHKAEISEFISAIRSGRPPIAPAEAYATTLTTLKIIESLKTGLPASL